MNLRANLATVSITTVLWLASFACPAEAQEIETQVAPEPPQPVEAEMKPSEVGVRFTPRMAGAISNQLARGMTQQYSLNDEQVSQFREIIAGRLMKAVSENAVNGRDAVELLMATAIESQGRLSKEDAQVFGKLVRPLVPAFRDFVSQTAGEISRDMTVKQRLKFTADLAKATAGLVVFENRMKRWEEGQVSDGANPFWDAETTGNQTSWTTSQVSEDPREKPEHREVRRMVEQQLHWRVDVEERWEEYVNHAIEFYDLDESQTNAAKGVLADVVARARAVKTPQWRTAIKENRIAEMLSWRIPGREVSEGPWMFSLESRYEQLTKPLFDLGTELKRRVEGIPTSAQRAQALEKVRKALADKGMERLPS
jgi:hypothetical protein